MFGRLKAEISVNYGLWSSTTSTASFQLQAVVFAQYFANAEEIQLFALF